MSNYFFTSDTHFFHRAFTAAGTINNRPMFKDEHEMNETLVKNWNAKVGKNDIVMHMGDFAVGVENRTKELNELAYSLNGTIELVDGNHENWAHRFLEKRIKFLGAYHEHHVKGHQLIILFHYAMRVWRHSHKGAWHLYGHSHGDLGEYLGAMSFDIGVDSHNFSPLAYEEVEAIMKQKQNEVASGRDPETLIFRKANHNKVKHAWSHHGSSL